MGKLAYAVLPRAIVCCKRSHLGAYPLMGCSNASGIIYQGKWVVDIPYEVALRFCYDPERIQETYYDHPSDPLQAVERGTTGEMSLLYRNQKSTHYEVNRIVS